MKKTNTLYDDNCDNYDKTPDHNTLAIILMINIITRMTMVTLLDVRGLKRWA